MEIGVVGLGRIGLPLALVLCKAGFQVKGIDLSNERIGEIKTRKEFFEPQLNEYLDKYGRRLEVSTDYSALKDAPLVFIVAQTPSLKNGKFDLNFVKSAVQGIHQANPEALIVVSSTINIGDMDKLSKMHRKVCYNPEFIKQGSIIHDFENPKFTLIGAYNSSEGEKVANVWREIHNKPIYIVSPVEAEITKLSLNVSFTLGITFANMIGEVCENFGADSNKVLDVIYKDRRNYKAGLGFGGPCFPRDVTCFRASCEEENIKSGYRFASLIEELNQRTMNRYYRAITSTGRKRIGIVGVAYKPGVPLIDGSQSLAIAKRLMDDGYELHVYDPLAEKEARKVLNRADVKFHSKLQACIEQSDVVFVGTPQKIPTLPRNKVLINPWS